MIVIGLIIGIVVGLILGALFIIQGIAVLFNLTVALPVQLIPMLGWITQITIGPPLMMLLVVLFIMILVTFLLYLGAQISSTPSGSGAITTDPLEEFCRGFMIGMNTGVNFIVLALLLRPAIAGPIALINMIAAFPAISGNPIYQGFLGWFSWLMPMSWPATFLGFFVFLVNRIAVALNLGPININLGIIQGTLDSRLAATPYRFNWETGSIITHGGFLTVIPGGYNLGNFIHVHLDQTDFPDSPLQQTVESLILHETGHTLNVAAFGWIFHVLIGNFHQNVLGALQDAYSELTAESHRRASPQFWVPIWGTNSNTAPVAEATADFTVVAAGSPITLTGTMIDPESSAGTFFWRLTATAMGSAIPVAPLPNPYLATQPFTPDVPGNYTLSLIVNDNIENSLPDDVDLVAT